MELTQDLGQEAMSLGSVRREKVTAGKPHGFEP